MTIAQALDWAKSRLFEGESPAIDARVLLCHVLNCSTTTLLTYPEKPLTDAQIEQFTALIEQRKIGKPVSYLTGKQDFWTLTLNVNEHTLIPRPETELLVERTLQLHELNPLKQPAILDLGTGTGAIALALASELPQSQVLAVDFIQEAVELAKYNAQQLALKNVSVLQSSWFSNIPQQSFDFIVTNPPYVESQSPWLSEGDVRFEPDTALTSGEDGLDDIRLIIDHAVTWLNPRGWLLIEHGHLQSEAIQGLLVDHGYDSVTTESDYSGLPRMCYAQKRVA
ncbi:peptide chain release factor N(5)-glutamine methyltransferase [Alteromonas sp. a30]|uniref:peptide chain release factor N(5)-glutamine methyltransferase n=1 Tax=Alteromonas sp. a30 TaxID=2730917 RepID=UPI002281ECB5|nr:peptide chain release factor N(5)-glutamine methyltransferase [Alteromonas sp. a30]MCY7296989.1 peptide chain release factor N(5)-glutamine methyltransferase [Alteromonas sp. a30]